MNIREIVREHYGVPNMPVIVLKRRDEIAVYEATHTEVDPRLWEFVNHDLRLLREWACLQPCIDLIVWHENTQEWRFVQDICFKDAYPTEQEWHEAIYQLIKGREDMYIVLHLD